MAQPTNKAQGDRAPENRLRHFREGDGLTRARLAKLAGVDAATIRNIENRKTKPTAATTNSVVNGLNANEKKRDKEHKYSVHEVFPLAPPTEGEEE